MQPLKHEGTTPEAPTLTDAEVVADALEFARQLSAKCDVLSLRGNEEANRALERLHDARVYLENLANRLANQNTSPA